MKQSKVKPSVSPEKHFSEMIPVYAPLCDNSHHKGGSGKWVLHAPVPQYHQNGIPILTALYGLKCRHIVDSSAIPNVPTHSAIKKEGLLRHFHWQCPCRRLLADDCRLSLSVLGVWVKAGVVVVVSSSPRLLVVCRLSNGQKLRRRPWTVGRRP